MFTDTLAPVPEIETTAALTNAHGAFCENPALVLDVPKSIDTDQIVMKSIPLLLT